MHSTGQNSTRSTIRETTMWWTMENYRWNLPLPIQLYYTYLAEGTRLAPTAASHLSEVKKPDFSNE